MSNQEVSITDLGEEVHGIINSQSRTKAESIIVELYKANQNLQLLSEGIGQTERERKLLLHTLINLTWSLKDAQERLKEQGNNPTYSESKGEFYYE